MYLECKHFLTNLDKTFHLGLNMKMNRRKEKTRRKTFFSLIFRIILHCKPYISVLRGNFDIILPAKAQFFANGSPRGKYSVS